MNNKTETNTKTIIYIDNSYLYNNKIATTIVNPTPSLNENYLRIPEGITDNVVPGLDSVINIYSIRICVINSITEFYSQHN